VSSRKILALLVIMAAGWCIYSLYPPQDKIKLGLDIKGGMHIRLEVDREKMGDRLAAKDIGEAADRALEILRNRIDGLGVTEPLLQREGEGGIVVQLPGLSDYKRAQDVILSTAQLEFRLVSNYRPADYTDKDGNIETKRLPKDISYFRGKDAGDEYLCEKVLLTGATLMDAHVETDSFGRPVIAFKFNPEGGRDFGRITGANVNRRLAIVLDEKVYSAPVIKSRIPGGSGIIEGSFTDEEAKDLALILKAGALPAPLKITSQYVVGPTLGADAVRKGTRAAFIGFLLVLLYMVVYYRVSGIIANVGMVMNIIFLLGILVWLKATLTLPGIAGIVLTVGMSVDSNVLIFERIREELKLGKTIRAAIEAGYKRALTAIIDSHLTTLITAVVLFQFGTGPIKGFAVTLTLGVALSLFTAVVITKMIFDARKEYSTLSI
jgi:protein-export membrane protein SecD